MLLVALLVIGAIINLNQSSKTEALFRKIFSRVTELEIVTNEYVMHHEERMLQQWHVLFHELGNSIKELKHSSIKQELLQDYRVVGEIFDRITSINLRMSDIELEENSLALINKLERNEKILVQELILSLQKIYFRVQNFSNELFAQHQAERGYYLYGVLLAVLVLGIFVILLIYRIKKIISQPLTHLITGIKKIGAGDLDYKIGTLKTEEYSRIAEAVDTMTENLKKVTSSRDALNKEMEERRKILLELEKSEKLLKDAQKIAHIGYWVWDIDQNIYHWSDEIFRIFGYEPGEIEPSFQTFISMLPEKDKTQMISLTRGLFHSKSDKELLIQKLGQFQDFMVKTKDGTIKYLQQRITVKMNHSFDVSQLSGTIQDITQIKENEIRLKESLKEKELMLQEIHHRVKNNMQVVSGLISMQAHGIKDTKIQEIFKSIQNRICSMARVHEDLYQSDNFRDVEVEKYIRDLIEHLYDSYRIDQDKISLELHVNDVVLDIRTALPLGIILNELITNVFKHAYPGSSKGKLYILLQQNKDEYQLIVKDEGIGFSQEDYENATSLGLQLIQGLVQQIHGEIEFSGVGGVEFKITFNDIGNKIIPKIRGE